MEFEVTGVVELFVSTEVTADDKEEASVDFTRLMREFGYRSLLTIDSVGEVAVWDINEAD